MPTRLSRALGVSHKALIGQGAFDGFIDIDSKLYVDPHLLAATQVPELQGAATTFGLYFENVLKLLRVAKVPSDLTWRSAQKLMRFPEISETGLGHSRHSTSGHAIGPKLAAELTSLAKEIVDAGIVDPDLFTLLGLMQEGIGADLISDMTVSIILPHLLAFSERVAKKLKIPTIPLTEGHTVYRVPVTTQNAAVILVPASLLRRLPVAYSWDDIDTVSAHNAALRQQVNHKIGDTWKKATSNSVKKKELRAAVLKHPELMSDLLEQYHAKRGVAYDLTRDPAGVQIWFEVATELAETFPLDLSAFKKLTPDKLLSLVNTVCQRFKQLVEDNRLGRLLYNDDGSLRLEKAAQLTFFALAVFYCDTNNLDVTPEADAGAGPVDFKFSRGSAAKVHVEVKLSTNRQLLHGFEVQLPAYNKAERTDTSILLVIRTADKDTQLKKVIAAAAKAKKGGLRAPDLIVVDGRPQKSASKRKR